jgi:hypothetical protein
MTTFTCICPPKTNGDPRHPAGDTVTLRPTLSFRAAIAARNTIAVAKTDDPDISVAETLALLTEQYLLLGIESWTLVDAKGQEIPPDRPAIRAFLEEHTTEAMAISDEADDLYRDAVLLPLVAMASASSPPTPTESSTSPTNGHAETTPKPSKRSSTSTSRTAVTGTTPQSPAGASN